MKLKGITGLGEWVTWDPAREKMVIGQGGTWIIEDGVFSEHRRQDYSDPGFLRAQGRLLTPGLIDPHTHPAFAESRELEFEMRGQGRSYMEIAAAGGGILNSVAKLRELDEDTLTTLIRERLQLMLAHGTTTAECKSGYGLSTDSECRSLRAIGRAAEDLPIRIRRTFLGAHEVPSEYREQRENYVDLLVDEMIPAVAVAGLADYCDVFCEEGAYTVTETRRILETASAHGLLTRIHADEFVSTGGAELAAEMGCVSADHLMAISEDGIRALAEAGTVATLLPGTTFFLGQGTWAPARKMLDSGVTLALATDFNPGSSMTVSMPFIMSLAVIYLQLTPLEVLQAATYGGARALGLDSETGCLAAGYAADAALWSCRNHRELPYFYAVNQLAELVSGGELVTTD